MDVETFNKDKLAALIQESGKIAVIPSKVAGVDAFCAGVAVYQMLKKAEKDAYFIYSGKIPDKAENLINQEDITSDVQQRGLLVSIDYTGTEAAKVHYSTENDVLYLKISPVPYDFRKDDRIKSRITGYDFDLIFVIGAQNVYDLGQTYRNLDTVSKISKLINIDITERNERFGFVNIIDSSVDSLSLLVLQKATVWELVPDEKSAKALLTGILSKVPTYKG